MGALTETERITRLIERGGERGLTEREFFARELEVWRRSEGYRDMLLGERYYEGRQDILGRERTAIGTDGRVERVGNLPNHRVVDNLYALMVDQKTNYLLGKPFTVDCESEAYARHLKGVFDRRFRRTLRRLGTDALNGGVGWLYVYYDEEGRLRFRRLPPYEVLPFWRDGDHTELDCAARLFRREAWDGNRRREVELVDLFTAEGVDHYVLDGGELIPDAERGGHEPYLQMPGGEGYNWRRIPLIPWRYCDREKPLITRVKSLQDGINALLSDFENNMQEDARNTILVLKNYDGTDLGEFRRNLAAYGCVKVREDGGVDTLEVKVDAGNYRAILELFKKALIENARGYDAKDQRLGGNPNQMNIQSMYSDIDLDANGMETEFQASFQELLWFVDRYFLHAGLGDFTGEAADIVFNRDMLINESEAIEGCVKSAGILSRETIVGQHPWTVDAGQELSRIRREQETGRRKGG